MPKSFSHFKMQISLMLYLSIQFAVLTFNFNNISEPLFFLVPLVCNWHQYVCLVTWPSLSSLIMNKLPDACLVWLSTLSSPDPGVRPRILVLWPFCAMGLGWHYIARLRFTWPFLGLISILFPWWLPDCFYSYFHKTSVYNCPILQCVQFLKAKQTNKNNQTILWFFCM